MFSNKKLLELQRLATERMGTKDVAHQRGLVFEQQPLIEELKPIPVHLEALEAERMQVVARAREGRIVTSIPGIGPLQAAILLALIGTIANSDRPGQLTS